MTEPTMGRRWADDGPTIISSSAHRRPIGGPSSADCRRRAIGYQLVMPSVAHRRSRRWADDGPPAACYLGYSSDKRCLFTYYGMGRIFCKKIIHFSNKLHSLLFYVTCLMHQLICYGIINLLFK